MVRQRVIKPLNTNSRFPTLDNLPTIYEFSEAQEGLVPIPNTPFYYTPDTPADPMDCNRYPDSIYCGNPISTSPVEFNVDVVKDECNTGIQFSGSLAFIQMAPFQIVHRNKDCRVPEEPPEPPPPISEEGDTPEIPLNYCREDIKIDGKPMFVWMPVYFYRDNHYFTPQEPDPPYDYAYIEGTSKVTQLERCYPGGRENSSPTGWRIHYETDYKYHRVIKHHFGSDYSTAGEGEISESKIIECEDDRESFVIAGYPPFRDFHTIFAFFSTFPYIIERHMQRNPSRDNHAFGRLPEEVIHYQAHEDEEIIDYGTIELDRSSMTTSVEVIPIEGSNSVDVYYTCKYNNYNVNYVIQYKLYMACEDTTYFDDELPRREPPPPPRMRKCCPDYSALLKKIYQECKKANKRIGSDEFPATVPESFLKEDGKEAGTKEIENLGELIAWLSERLDELVGEFEIPITVEDIDLIQDGNQELKIKLPNIAEAMAEIFSLVLNNSVNQEIVLALATKAMVEAGNTKQVATKNNYILEAIVDYLAFKTKETTTKLPLTFTPDTEEFSLLLKEKRIDMTVMEYDDKQNLQAALTELLFAGSVIRGAFYRRLEKPSIAKQEIQDNIFRALQIKKNLGDVSRPGTKEIQEFIDKLTKDDNGNSSSG